MPVKRKPVTPEFFNFDEFVLRKLADAYGLPTIDSFCPVLLDGEYCSLLEVRSETSRKIVVETNTERFFLKQIPWYCDDELRLAFSHQLQKQLFQRGIPVPKIIPTLAGNTWLTINDLKFTLFEYVDGQRFDGSVEHIRSAATVLAELHKQQLRFESVPREDLFDLILAHIDLASEILTETRESARSAPLFLELTDVLTRERSACLSYGWNNLDVIAVHGDYNPWNLLFYEDDSYGVKAILDFDNCEMAPRLHDIAEAMVTFCALNYRGDSTNFASEVSVQFRTQEASIFLRAYGEILELSPTELQCLPSVIRAIFIELTCLGLIRGDFGVDQSSNIIEWLNNQLGFDVSR